MAELFANYAQRMGSTRDVAELDRIFREATDAYSRALGSPGTTYSDLSSQYADFNRAYQARRRLISSPTAPFGVTPLEPGGADRRPPDRPFHDRAMHTALQRNARPPSEATADQRFRAAFAQHGVSVTAEGNRLTLRPTGEEPFPKPPPRAPGVRGFQAKVDRTGALTLNFDRPIQGVQHVSMSLQAAITARLGPGPESTREIENLRQRGVDVASARPAVVVHEQGSPNPTFVFPRTTHELSVDARGQRVDDPQDSVGARFAGFTVCAEVQSWTKGGAMLGGSVRKPVIYLYPTQSQRTRVEVELAGQLTTTYPKPNIEATPQRAVWEVIATPSGELLEPQNERTYAYLFWEGTPGGFTIDPKQAFCVAGGDAERFLDEALQRQGLNTRERSDFVSYWLPALERNPWSLVTFVSAEAYEAYAKMTVTPEPASLLRVFMVFRGIPEPVAVGAPDLPRGKRSGFTVVEWGGANLDD